MNLLIYFGILMNLFVFNTVQANIYKFCVPKLWLKNCEEMVKETTKSDAQIQCIPGRDRVECLNFVQQRQADFTTAEPEDMYLAKNIPNEDFILFQEIRTILEPSSEYRYQAIMLVRNSLKINSLEGLKGLRSCHTGINRNVGYKIPLTMLMKRGILEPMNDLSLSPKENELKAFSHMFNKSCIVGKWSPDSQTDSRLKKKYSNLCAMCEKPAQCDYPDNYSGYDGSIRCLVHNNGDVAFTKVIYVKMFFGLPVGPHKAKDTGENPDEYSYLCGDGSKLPVRGPPCSWAARPWLGFIGHQDILDNVDPLRNKLRQLADIGIKKNASWVTHGLTMFDDETYLYDNTPKSPREHLENANYTIVIERGHGEPEPVVRMCVTSDVAYSKCQIISTTAFSRDIRPKLECVLSSDEDSCIQLVKENKADAAAVTGRKVYNVMKSSTLTPFLSEAYAKNKNQYAVAVVKKTSNFNSWNDVINSHVTVSLCRKTDTLEGNVAPIYSLVKQGFLRDGECGSSKFTFYSPTSCNSGKCEVLDAVKCLDDNNGIIAFVSNIDVLSLDTSKYELLCLEKSGGGRAPLDKWDDCNLMMIPPMTWMGVASRFRRPTDSINHLMLTVLDLSTKQRPELLDMFGEFLSHNDIIFSSSAKALVVSDSKWFDDFENIRKKANC